MAGFYFHWVSTGHSFSEWSFASIWNPAYAVVDEDVLSFQIEHQEGQIPSLSIEVRNPKVGLLSPGRKVWAWLAYDNNGTPEPLFFGRLVGIPTDLLGEAVTLQFTAKPYDYIRRKQTAAEPLKIRPYYDAVFIDAMKRDDPDTILEGYSRLWHVDRVTLEVSSSDVLIGEDGLIDFTYSDVPYDSVKFNLNQVPLASVFMEATVNWQQEYTDYLHIGEGEFLTYSGDGLLGDWPQAGAEVGSGWTAFSSLMQDVYRISTTQTVSYENNLHMSYSQPQEGNLVSREESITAPVWGPFDKDANVIAMNMSYQHVSGLIDSSAKDFNGDPAPINRPSSTESSTTYVPLWKMKYSLTMRYTSSRQRTEQVQFIMFSDTQPVLVDPTVTQDTEEISLTGADVSQPIINLVNWSSVSGLPVVLGQFIFPDDPSLPGQKSIQVCVVSGIAGLVEPTFSNIAGVTTVDGSVTWSSLGASGSLYSTANDWTPFTDVPLGDMILPRRPAFINYVELVRVARAQIPKAGTSVSKYQIIQVTGVGFYECTIAGITKYTTPTWITTGDVTDGSVIWRFLGATLPDGASYFICTRAGVTGEFLPPFGNMDTSVSDNGIIWTRLPVAEVPVGGAPGNTPRKAYFPSDRGLWSLEYLLCVSRARLRIRARAVEIEFECRLERASTLSCRMNARIHDPRFPGGVATGKIISYSLKAKGDTGEIIGTVRIGCAVGTDGITTGVVGTTSYVQAGYVQNGYQQITGQTLLTGNDDIGYTPPVPPLNDDFNFPLTIDQVAIGGGINTHGDLKKQEEAVWSGLVSAYYVANPPEYAWMTSREQALYQLQLGQAAAQNSVANNLMYSPRWISLDLKPISGARLDHAYIIKITSPITIPKMIDLMATTVAIPPPPGSTSTTFLASFRGQGLGHMAAVPAVPIGQMGASLVGTSSMVAKATASYLAKVAFAGVGSIVNKGSTAYRAGSLFAGSGSLVSVAKKVASPSASFAGVGAMVTQETHHQLMAPGYASFSSEGLFPDAFAPYTQLFLPGNGTNGSTVIPDMSPNPKGNATVVGAAVLDTSVFFSRPSSIHIPGSASQLTYPFNQGWNFGSSPWTVEGYFVFNATPTTAMLVGFISPSLSSIYWGFYFSAGTLKVTINGSTPIASLSFTPILNRRYHLCAEVGTTGKLRIYIDGVMRASAASISPINDGPTGVLMIGSATGYSTGIDMNGWIDDLRITSGAARYSSDAGFTLPYYNYDGANLVGEGIFSASAVMRNRGSAALVGAGALVAVADKLNRASFVGAGTMITDARKQADTGAAFAGVGTMVSNSSGPVSDSANLSGSGIMTAVVKLRAVGSATFAGNGVMGCDATVHSPISQGEALFAGVGTMAGAPQDPNWASVVLLAGFEDTDGATTFIDESASAKTITTFGNAQVDTAQFKYGASSLLLDGTGDYATLAASSDFDFSGQFTIEFFVRFNGTVSDAGLITRDSVTSADIRWYIYMNTNTLYWNAYDTNDVLKFISYAWTHSGSTWYHIAVDKDGSGNVRLYIDGVKVGGTSTMVNGTRTTGTAPVLNIGSDRPYTSYDLNGWMDEIRITKGVARYATDTSFTVPTSSFPRS